MYARGIGPAPRDAFDGGNIVRRLDVDGVRVLVVRDLDGCGPVWMRGRLMIEDQGDEALTDAVIAAQITSYKKTYPPP